MYSLSWVNNVNKSDVLPPLTVSKSVKESERWQKAVLDSFEHIGITQFQENLKFWDYYRMVEGKMSYQELSEVIPHLENLQDLLDGVGVPSFLRHYDIIGVIVNTLVGMFLGMQDKFHVIDTSEVAQSEFLRFKDEEFQSILKDIIELEVNRHLAENGLTPDGKQFNSEEEQQQFLQELEMARQKFTPKDSERDSKTTYKGTGVRWAEATLEKDRENPDFNMARMDKVEFRDYLLTGRCFREYKLYGDKYAPKTWSPKNTFFSKELDNERVENGEYVGRIHFYTPSEVIKEYGHLIPADKQKELLGGNESWKSFVGDGIISGTIQQAIRSNFNKPTTVPFTNFYDYNFALGIQDELGIPMGEQTLFEKDGTTRQQERFLPRFVDDTYGRYSFYANILRDDFDHRKDLCQVTEVYFRAYDKLGFLTYENEWGRIVTEEVTEDILKDFLKDRNIKVTLKESLVDILDNLEVGTLKWIYRPVTYEGVKIQSGNLRESMYLYCKPMEYQIKGDSEFDTKLPVAGRVGRGIAAKIYPFQVKYNFCMNQIYNLLEKELGMFFLLDTALIPSEFADYGNAEEALINLRNVAKETGVMPIATSGDAQRNNNNFNQFSTYRITYAEEIATRIQLAEFAQRKAYEQIGINPQQMATPTKYVTAEGVKLGQETSYAQISDIFDEFNSYRKGTLELHLGVAQYAQSNNKDLSLYYTKGDGSIVFLQMSDPAFPLRRLGLIPSDDSRKRKELETMKQYLLNTNTISSDVLEIAKLISSDTMSEVLEIAKIEREHRERLQEQQHQRQQELLAQQTEADRQAMLEKWELSERSKEADRQNNIERERIKAHGRAADNESDQASFMAIDKAADRALKELDIESQANLDAMKMKQRESEAEFNRDMKLREFNLKLEQLRTKQQEIKSKEYIAAINKN